MLVVKMRFILLRKIKFWLSVVPWQKALKVQRQALESYSVGYIAKKSTFRLKTKYVAFFTCANGLPAVQELYVNYV